MKLLSVGGDFVATNCILPQMAFLRKVSLLYLIVQDEILNITFILFIFFFRYRTLLGMRNIEKPSVIKCSTRVCSVMHRKLEIATINITRRWLCTTGAGVGPALQAAVGTTLRSHVELTWRNLVRNQSEMMSRFNTRSLGPSIGSCCSIRPHTVSIKISLHGQPSHIIP